MLGCIGDGLPPSGIVNEPALRDDHPTGTRAVIVAFMSCHSMSTLRSSRVAGHTANPASTGGGDASTAFVVIGAVFPPEPLVDSGSLWPQPQLNNTPTHTPVARRMEPCIIRASPG